MTWAKLISTLSGDYWVFFGGGMFGSRDSYGWVEANGQSAIGNPFIRGYHDWLVWYYESDSNWFNPLPDKPIRFVVVGTTEHEGLVSVLTDAITTATTTVLADVGTRATQQSVDTLASAFEQRATTLESMVATLSGVVATEASLAAIAASLPSSASIAALQSAVTDLSAVVGVPAQTTDVQDARAALTGEIQSRASQQSLDDLAALFGNGSDRSLQQQIETALVLKLRVASLFLPNSAGGHLEDVRAFVSAMLDNAAAIGIDTTRAQADLLKGDAVFAAGDVRVAYDWYLSAYQRLLK